MSKDEAEKIVKDTIEYANNEIKKNKHKCIKKVVVGLIAMLIIIFTYLFIFKYEFNVKYNKNLINVSIPEDEGLDVTINLQNYAKAKAVLVKTNENTYDLYIGVTQTIASKIIGEDDKSNNLLRVGNGMVVDFKSSTLLGYMPNGNSAKSIVHIYYIDNLSNRIMCMNDEELMSYKDKTLIWESSNI